MKFILTNMSVDLLREYVSLITEKIRSGRGALGQNERTHFSLQKFKSLSDQDEIIKYAESHLDYLGQGSSRIVFVLNSRRVLKIALNEKGVGQNEAEIDVYTNPQSKPIVTAIYDYDKHYNWVISDVVKQFNYKSSSYKEFEKLAGIAFEDMMEDYYSFAPKSEIAKALKATAKSNQLLSADIHNIEHWGKTPDGRVVVLDYGYTQDVYQKYYTALER